MKLKFFDFETFPEWWCVVVSDEEPSYQSSPYNNKFDKLEEQKIKGKMRIYSSDQGRPGLEALRREVSTGVLCGYNSKFFDLVILKCVLLGFTPRQVYIAAEIIVNPGLANKDAEYSKISQYVRGWTAKYQGCQAAQDLMDDETKAGLKVIEAALGMDIRETTVPFGKTSLTQQEKEDIIFYCKHDVYALHVFYACVSKPYIDTKLNLGSTYEIDEKTCYASTNAVLASKVLGAVRAHGTTIKDPTIVIYQEPIRKYIEKWVPKEALNHLLTSQKPKSMTMFENKVSMADGGIHSVYITPKVGRKSASLFVEATESWGIFNIDLSGCHPSVMLFCGAMSRGITKPERFKESVFRRRELKVKPKDQWTENDIKFVPAGKLIHNTTYGAMGNEHLPLYDDYMRSKVCRVSQMIIIAVILAIFTQIPEIKVIQTNTDGIMLYMKREYLGRLKAIIKEFEDLSNFVFEIEEDSRVWQLNVNNYIAENISGKLKLKGKACITTIFQPGYNKVRPLGYHVIAKIQADFYSGKITNPVLALLEHDSVADFCVSYSRSKKYKTMVQKCRDGDIDLGRVARVIATTTEKYGAIKKQKFVDGVFQEDTCANSPGHTWVINDALYNYRFEGKLGERELVHIPTGMRAKIDWAHYARMLDTVLDRDWYKLKNGQFAFTHEFNLKEVK